MKHTERLVTKREANKILFDRSPQTLNDCLSKMADRPDADLRKELDSSTGLQESKLKLNPLNWQ